MIRRTLPIATVIIIICIYQLYWLTGEYTELCNRFSEDIQEALRSSDFEELTHRVDEISKMRYKGRVDINMGYDHRQKTSIVQSEVTEITDTVKQSDSQMVVSPASFSSILRSPEDLKKIGLNMQRGIHAAIDGIKAIDLNYLDKTLTGKLHRLGLEDKHILLLQKKTSDGEIQSHSAVTLEKTNIMASDPTGVFRLEISPEAEYVMLIPRWHMAVLKKMAPIILFSAFTLLLLILTFWYMIHNMRKQQRLEEIKTDFTNNITHELKTPIAVAYAANDSLLNFDATRNTPRMNRYLNVCQEQLRLLDRLVEQILSLSMERKQSLILNYEDVSVKELIESIISTFSIKYADNIAFIIDIEKDLTMTTDRMHLSNIIGNLIDNAIKYSHNQAVVKLEAYRDSKNQIVIKVIDNGIGITSEQQKLIFDKFYRVPHGNVHDVKGYGLGLFYVKSMTKNLGGTVCVKSIYGKGSSFILKFK